MQAMYRTEDDVICFAFSPEEINLAVTLVEEATEIQRKSGGLGLNFGDTNRLIDCNHFTVLEFEREHHEAALYVARGIIHYHDEKGTDSSNLKKFVAIVELRNKTRTLH